MKHDQLFGKKPRHFLALLPAVFLALVTTAAVADNRDHDNDRDRGKKPLVIKEQGGFSFGGKVEVDAAGESRHCDHGYADFLIPTKARENPIIMWHSTHVKTWESNPSFMGGHPAFDYIFASRGWGVYIIDPPRQGRANYGCFAPDFISNWPQPGRDRSFISWRLGTWDIPGGEPTYFPGSRMAPLDNGELIDQILRARYPDNEHVPDAFPVQVEAVAELLEKTGPAILFTHSGSGRPGWMTVFESPKVAAIVSFEPSVFAFPEGELPPPIPDGGEQLEVPLADFQKLTQIPILVIVGDFLDQVPSGLPRLANSQAFVETVNKHGGNAKLIHLPDEGTFGNSHVMMLEENNAEIADFVSQFLKDNGLDKRDDGDHKGRPGDKHEDDDKKRGGKHADDDDKGRHDRKHAER
jgi:hypothetical protein